MAGIAFGDPARAPDLLFLHATGMNALTYRQMLEPLGERYHVVALDARGHGRTQLPERRWFYRSWTRHRDDVIEALEGNFQGPVTLAGHSMGATTSLLIAGARPDLARGLCLIEPVLRADAFARAPGVPAIARAARRRRAAFASRAEAIAALTGRGFFKTFSPEALADYVEDGFVEDEDGVRLACSPSYEAATFMAQNHDPWSSLAHTSGPLVVLRAEIGSTCSEDAAQRIADVRADARVATLAGATHALPIERPDRARAALETTLMMAEGQARFHDIAD